jgi:hypothetical protein
VELVFEQSLRSESRSYDVNQHMADFFVSYTSADKAWAEWIGYVLEEEGFAVDIQVWDFRPGNNFVLEMLKSGDRSRPHDYGLVARLPEIAICLP